MMEKKTIDLSKSVYDIVNANPEVKDIMCDLGFTEIVKPIMLNTMGKMMTIPKGARVKEIPLSTIIDAFELSGFEVINTPEQLQKQQEEKMKALSADLGKSSDLSSSDREALLKSYVQRLSNGEDIESVRKDFAANFSDVSAVEIARAEQTLLSEGTKLSDVQRLCDVHSALFHGATRSEKIANAEKEVERSAEEERVLDTIASFDEQTADATTVLMRTPGHPLNILELENAQIEKRVIALEEKLKEDVKPEDVLADVSELRAIESHYKKKEETMFPLLKDKYNFPGPSDVMWGVEDEIKQELKKFVVEDTKDMDSLRRVVKRMNEMIFKEKNILFPLVTNYFTEDEWIAIARDFPMYGYCYLAKEDVPVWDKVKELKQSSIIHNENIEISGGHMNLKQLKAMLNTLPFEITLVDENDINIYFNEGEKVFTRPQMAIGRPVYSCHPKRVEPIVRMLISDFKKGKRDSLTILSERSGHPVVINYFALRDDDGTYLGTLEAVQIIDGLADAIKNNKKGPIDL